MGWKNKKKIAQVLRMRKETCKSMAINDDSIDFAREIVLFDRRVTNDEVAHPLQISHGSAYEVI